MTTPVFTQALDDGLSDVSIQIVLPLDKELDKYAPNKISDLFHFIYL